MASFVLAVLCKNVRNDNDLYSFLLTIFKHFVIIKQRTACAMQCPYVSRKRTVLTVAGKICFRYGKVSDVRRNAVC